MPDIPQIIGADPVEARPGDSVRLTGNGFQRGDILELRDDTGAEDAKRLSGRVAKLVSETQWDVTLPKRLSGGTKRPVIIRGDMAYPASVTLEVVPLISGLVAAEGTELTIRGHGFAPTSHVMIGDLEIVPSEVGPEHLAVTLPQDVSLADALAPSVRAPSLPPVAGPRPVMDVTPTATTGFDVNRDGFSFANSADYQAASWGTFVETFGQSQVKSANRLPTFLFLWAYYALYTSFFEGVGPFQVSGLCSGLASLCLERFCAGASPNIDLELTKEVRQELTVRMGKVLGRQVLTLAYDQCKQGLANVPVTLNKLQASLQGDIKAETAQMLWFLPSGKITQRKFMEQLSNAHSVVPYTVLDLGASRWRIPIYDVNLPRRNDAWVQVEQQGNEWTWFHNLDARFSSQTGMTMATMPLQLFMAPAEFPFSGPFGLTGFLYDMLV